MPMALDPPPTQAATASGSVPVSSSTWARASSPMTRWKSRTIRGTGAAGDRTDEVVGVRDVGDPVAHRLVHRVLERAGAARHRDDLGAEQAHPGDVERLPAGVLLAHVDGALEAEQRRRGGRRHAVLPAPVSAITRACPSTGEQRLAEHIVDLVGAGVVEVLALEQDRGPRRRARRSGGRRSAATADRCSRAAGRRARLELVVGATAV
jgi:ribosomal protein L32